MGLWGLSCSGSSACRGLGSSSAGHSTLAWAHSLDRPNLPAASAAEAGANPSHFSSAGSERCRGLRHSKLALGAWPAPGEAPCLCLQPLRASRAWLRRRGGCGGSRFSGAVSAAAADSAAR